MFLPRLLAREALFNCVGIDVVAALAAVPTCVKGNGGRLRIVGVRRCISDGRIGFCGCGVATRL